MALDGARYAREVQAQTGLLAAQLTPETLFRQVPTCPEWALRDLATHVGSTQRWVTEIVAERLREPPAPPPGERPGHPPPAGADELARWLRQGASALAAALTEAGPEIAVWSWSGDDRVSFWARRMANEAAVHAVDAQLVTGPLTPIAPDLAADGISEWLWILPLRPAAETSARLPVRPGGETLHLHAIDPELSGHPEGEWLIRRAEHGISWEPGHMKADVAVRGPSSELFLLLMRRRDLTSAAVEVLGDRSVLEAWLERFRF